MSATFLKLLSNTTGYTNSAGVAGTHDVFQSNTVTPDQAAALASVAAAAAHAGNVAAQNAAVDAAKAAAEKGMSRIAAAAAGAAAGVDRIIAGHTDATAAQAGANAAEASDKDAGMLTVEKELDLKKVGTDEHGKDIFKLQLVDKGKSSLRATFATTEGKMRKIVIMAGLLQKYAESDLPTYNSAHGGDLNLVQIKHMLQVAQKLLLLQAAQIGTPKEGVLTKVKKLWDGQAIDMAGAAKKALTKEEQRLEDTKAAVLRYTRGAMQQVEAFNRPLAVRAAASATYAALSVWGYLNPYTTENKLRGRLTQLQTDIERELRKTPGNPDLLRIKKGIELTLKARGDKDGLESAAVAMATDLYRVENTGKPSPIITRGDLTNFEAADLDSKITFIEGKITALDTAAVNAAAAAVVAAKNAAAGGAVAHFGLIDAAAAPGLTPGQRAAAIAAIAAAIAPGNVAAVAAALPAQIDAVIAANKTVAAVAANGGLAGADQNKIIELMTIRAALQLAKLQSGGQSQAHQTQAAAANLGAALTTVRRGRTGPHRVGPMGRLATRTAFFVAQQGGALSYIFSPLAGVGAYTYSHLPEVGIDALETALGTHGGTALAGAAVIVLPEVVGYGVRRFTPDSVKQVYSDYTPTVVQTVVSAFFGGGS